ncbi:MAG: hypothetical protein IH600_07270 [Bacteroidetes bacterium]|nr:hypothetical protein [Bacteroidota bacterium]
MKRFVIRAAGFGFFLLAILVAGIWLPPSGMNDSLLFALPDKMVRLEKLKSPRIVLIGGSSCSFGFESRIIEERTGRPVVNMGAHAGLGLKYFIDQVRDKIARDDIVVLSIEYEQLADGESPAFYGGSLLVPVVVDIDQYAVNDLDVNQWKTILKNIGYYSANKMVGHVETPIAAIFRKQALKKRKWGHYGRMSFNEYGDVRKELISVGFSVEPSKSCDGPLLKPAFEYLIRFDRYLKDMGAHLLVTYPAMQRSSLVKIAGFASEVDSALIAGGLTIIGKPTMFGVEDKDLFNTMYHLNASGRERHTLRFATLLQKHLKAIGAGL